MASSDESFNGLLSKYEREMDGVKEESESDESGRVGAQGIEGDLEPGNEIEELLRIEQMNAEVVDTPEVLEEQDKTEDLVKVLALMHRAGVEGTIDSNVVGFLEVFSQGLEGAWQELQAQTRLVLSEADTNMKGSAWRRINKQKPIKQRIKQAITEKSKRMVSKYDDMPFIVACTKDFCYKSGMRLVMPRAEKKVRQEKIDDRVHDKLIEFYVPRQQYEWEDEKITEFIACIFRD
ncbi:hypothetical protein NEHOM01_0081 [Nematocida homosporus]|uniref:uncharacterized protein n=1 Tax=Nematocida homosporus TaxID=1912981 RepID=UPI00221EBE09|nr:uncharacterized protein NEHOM01_0081 [Nematocida homosporus]KAI5184336.1 hypothetical protein NEHOM01_0081 [Nematocida homosporus]